MKSSQQWSLFGYDLSKGYHYFLAGWRDFIWADDSPVLSAIDEVVRVHQESGDPLYVKAAKPVPAATASEVETEAVLLPERLVLSRSLRVPLAAENDLESLVALEARASSPFPENDSCSGWKVSRRDATGLEIVLAISSRSAVMEYIGKYLGSHDIHAYEVWARAGDQFVVLSGFGEQSRRQANRRRLRRLGLLLGYCLLALPAIFAVGAGVKYLELKKVQEIHARVERSAEKAVELRSGLSDSKELLDVLNEMTASYPHPRQELNRLALVLGDDTWLTGMEIKGINIKIDGQSANASSVMQKLIDDPYYSSVSAPVAIKKVRSGMERFVLNLTLNRQSGPE